MTADASGEQEGLATKASRMVELEHRLAEAAHHIAGEAHTMTAEYHPTASNHQVDKYAHRQELNRASRAWAARDREPWSADEDAFLLEFWIDVECRDRDEITVSQALERTIEACRVRCEHIRRDLGIQTRSVVVKVTVTTELCPTCFTVLPHTGSCDYCS